MNIVSGSAEKSFFDVMLDIWKARYVMAVMAFAAFALALTFMLLARPYYRAEMIIAPASPISDPSGFKIKNYPDATLWQNQNVQNYPDFLKFSNKFNAPSVARLLLEDKKIIKGLQDDKAMEIGNSASKKSRSDISKSDPEYSIKENPKIKKWTAEKLSAYLKKKVHLEPLGNTPLRKLVYFHPDREFASYFLGRVYSVTDALIRQSVRLKTQERIDYLQESLSKLTNPDHRRALTNLLMEEERLKMLVSIDQPYASSVVEPPASSEKPAWPDPFLIFPVFILAGAFIGFIFHGLCSHDNKEQS